MNKDIILPTSYFPPVEFFKHYLQADTIIIEQHENFVKQTYRNRCSILGSNGKLDLSIPVKKYHNHTAVKDIQISFETAWQNLHWKSIVSAYNSSPYFIYFDYELLPFFERKEKFLLDFNLKIIEKICSLIKIDQKHTLSQEFIPYVKEDLRLEISPKNKALRQFETYLQVFDEKFGFTPNLSILDLIFNKGPESKSYLQAITFQ